MLALTIALTLAVLPAACGSGASSEPGGNGQSGGNDRPRVGIVYDLGGRGDRSFNDLAAAGLETLGDDIEVRELTPARGGADREELLRLLAGDGFDLVVAVGSLFAEPLRRVAEDHPAVSFAVVDADVDLGNVASLRFADAEGAFLMGAAAALRAGAGGGVGFVGGVDMDVIGRFAAGFEAGARHVDPDIAVETRFLSSPPDFGGFREPARAREVARGMFERGTRVVFHAAGGSGVGVFEAARDASTGGTRVWAIGVDVDQRRTVDPVLAPYVLTSMLKRVDLAVGQVVRDFVDGRFRGGPATFDLASGGVGFATGGEGFAEFEARIGELSAAVANGAVSVPGR